MKTLKLLLIILTLGLIISIILLYQSEKNCEGCELEQPDIEEPDPNREYDYALKVNYSDDLNFQVFQYDLANGYSIMGKLYLKEQDSTIIDSTLIDKIDFTLYEAGKCTRYEIKKVTYVGKDILDCDGYVFDFQIEPRTLVNEEKIFTWDVGGLTVIPGEEIHTIIKSCAYKNIVTITCDETFEIQIPELVNFSDEDKVKIMRRFPPFDCPAKFYE